MNKMSKLYEKSQQTFALVCIAVYCTLQSLANPLNDVIGIPYSASALFSILLTGIILGFMQKNNLFERYGLCRSPIPAARFLYYIPLIILSTTNLWNGIAVNFSLAGTVCRMACMLCVGFLEEVLIRGFLFVALAKDNVKTAVIVSSVTFGLGHLLNLINGSGMKFTENLFQIAGATVIGFLFVILFYRGKSLLPCIASHAAINILNTFANDTGLTAEKQRNIHLIMYFITAAYALVLIKTLPKNGCSEET